MKYYQHTKDLIHAQYVLQFINMSLEHYLQFSKFKFGDQLDVSVPRRVIESWKSELAACDKKQEILSKMVEYLGQELEGFVE